MGYYLAGFEVVGVDHAPQRHYPFRFHQADALTFLAAHGCEFDVIHASPPCQASSTLNAVNRRSYPELIEATRRLLAGAGRPYLIENVPRAPLHDSVVLCGAMFGLRLYRHRAFESNLPLHVPAHRPHFARCARNGTLPHCDQYMTITGGKHSRAWRQAAAESMGVPWAGTVREVCEAIPPTYTRFLGEQVLAQPSAAAA